MGWGGGKSESTGWGEGPWGAGGDTLQLVQAEAIRENMVRLTFSSPPKFTKILDPNDGSDAKKYSVDPIAGTIGMDGQPAREVNPTTVELSSSTTIDVWLDRSLSPYPAQYVATVADLVTADTGEAIDPDWTTFVFFGLQMPLTPNIATIAAPRRDFANPDDLSSLTPLMTNPAVNIALGSFVPDESGDYAADMGETSYRKRVFRRLFSNKNGFAHLPGYGAGLMGQVKRLDKPSNQVPWSADAEAQIMQEPETLKASVTFERDPRTVGLYSLRVRAKTRTGETLDELISQRSLNT